MKNVLEWKSAISRQLEELESEEGELKVQMEMVNDALLNDPELMRLQEEMKEAQKRYRMQKEALLNEPENVAIMEKVKDNKRSIKECKEALSSNLLGYYKDSGTLEFEDETGTLKRISFTGKITNTNQPELPFGDKE